MIGKGTIRNLTDTVFEVSYMWKLNPFEVMERPVSEIVELRDQFIRISNEIHKHSQG